jgi:hypothetical protein
MHGNHLSSIFITSTLLYRLFIFFIPIFSHADEGVMIELPEWWGNLSKSKLGSSKCPNLNGIYSGKGELYELLDGNATSASQNGQNESYARNHLIMNKIPIDRVSYPDQITSFAIEQDINSFSVKKPSWESARIQESYLLSPISKDYLCNDGWLILKATNETIGHESSHSTFKDSIRYSKLSDGALVGYITQSIKSSSIWTLGYGETHERVLFVKFPKQTIPD